MADAKKELLQTINAMADAWGYMCGTGCNDDSKVAELQAKIEKQIDALIAGQRDGSRTECILCDEPATWIAVESDHEISRASDPAEQRDRW